MAEEKQRKAQKKQDSRLAEGKSGQAREKESTEVGGRSQMNLATECPHCGKINYVTGNPVQDRFIVCYSCGQPLTRSPF